MKIPLENFLFRICMCCMGISSKFVWLWYILWVLFKDESKQKSFLLKNNDFYVLSHQKINSKDFKQSRPFFRGSNVMAKSWFLNLDSNQSVMNYSNKTNLWGYLHSFNLNITITEQTFGDSSTYQMQNMNENFFTVMNLNYDEFL